MSDHLLAEEYSRMEKLFHGYLKGEEYNIVEAYAIYNKTLISNFVNSLQILKSRSGSAGTYSLPSFPTGCLRSGPPDQTVPRLQTQSGGIRSASSPGLKFGC